MTAHHNEALSFLLLQRRIAPDLVLATTRDLTKLLYAEIKRPWLWDYLRTLALGVSQSIHTQSPLPPLLHRLKESLLSSLQNSDNSIESQLTLKVLIASLSRNAIRFTREDFLKCIPAFEQLFRLGGQTLSQLLFYSMLIVVSLLDDYSLMLSVQAAIARMDETPEGRRLSYMASVYLTEKRWRELMQEINDSFGFPINMPEEYLSQSCEKLVEWHQARCQLSVQDMDEKCLVVYIRGGGTDVTWTQFLHSMKHASDMHFCALLDSVVTILRLRVLDQELVRLVQTQATLTARVLLYILTYNSYPDSLKYPASVIYSLNIRKAISMSSGLVKDRLLTLTIEQLPYYYLPRFAEIEERSKNEEMDWEWLLRPERMTKSQMERWKEEMYWRPLKTMLTTLDIVAPESSHQDFELLNPLRIFKSSLFRHNSLTTELALWLLEVSLSVWEHYVQTYQTPIDVRVRSSFVLLMVRLTQQSECAQLLIQKLGKEPIIDERICEFLHCFWIENAMLIKLVHVQGYRSEHISTMVQHVDSVICTWDFIEELLHSNSQEKQLFALQLSGHMAQKYPTQRTLDILRMCLQHLEEESKPLPDVSLLESILDLYLKTFPQLSGRAKEVRKKLRRGLFLYTPEMVTMVR